MINCDNMLKNVVILMTSVINDDGTFYSQQF